MAITTRSKDITVHVDPISLTANIEILKGNNAQTYEKNLAEFKPDRRVISCVLMPSVSVADPDRRIDVTPEITSCEWYEGNTRITNNSEYTISDAKYPKHSLKISKNVDPDRPIEIRAVFAFVDVRKNKIVKVERTMTFYTSLYDGQKFNLKLIDQPQKWVIDPIRIPERLNDKWLYPLSAQLYTGAFVVEDEKAAYWWDYFDFKTNKWREFTNDEVGTMVFGRNADGTWNKSIQFDARYFKEASFRCRAAFYTDTKPSRPSNEILSVISSVNVEFPKTLRVDISQTAGAKIALDMSTPVAFQCVISDNMREIPAEKYELFRIIWKARSGKPGVPDKTIGNGRTIGFVPKMLGFDLNYSMSVYADVENYDVMAVMLSENKAIENGNKILITPKFK